MIVVVDNTFASPAVQRPIELGADIVLHGTTKYLNGHSDSVGGMVVVTNPAHAEWLKFYQNAAGAILSAFDSWLILRGTKTLAVRMTAPSTRTPSMELRFSKKVTKTELQKKDKDSLNSIRGSVQVCYPCMTCSENALLRWMDTAKVVVVH